MADIKLFVCCHQPNEVPRHPLIVPIQVGTALTERRFEGFLHDDVGKNISDKNHSYCELTAQYWVWRNVEADYYGFFHYRRYLYPDTMEKCPYRIEGTPTVALLEELGYERFSALIQKYDLIAPLGENMYVPVREHYANAPFHHRKDLVLIEQIIREHCPEYVPAMEQYFSQTICYFGNIYIMRRDIFQYYCSWLFHILKEFDQCADMSDYTRQEMRVNGYLAERLFGVWLTYMRKKLRILELPRVHFGTHSWKNDLFHRALPPSTKQRALVKQTLYKLSRKN